eukprot:1880667-Prymnesium_polylepis.2
MSVSVPRPHTQAVQGPDVFPEMDEGARLRFVAAVDAEATDLHLPLGVAGLDSLAQRLLHFLGAGRLRNQIRTKAQVCYHTMKSHSDGRAPQPGQWAGRRAWLG